MRLPSHDLLRLSLGWRRTLLGALLVALLAFVAFSEAGYAVLLRALERRVTLVLAIGAGLVLLTVWASYALHRRLTGERGDLHLTTARPAGRRSPI